MRAELRAWILCAAVAALCPAQALAKRKAPAPVPPVTADGVEYRAPLDSGTEGRVQAFAVEDGRKLWETKVYEVKVRAPLEADAQWVFIKRMKLQNGRLLVVDELSREYLLDPQNGKVLRADVDLDAATHGAVFWLEIAAALIGGGVILWLLGRRRMLGAK